ncbi:MAG: sulfatase-like hydrolase/transferase, partial [Candidatus Solibacter usitatus]|nr:sulfatase-like hydrolase/transferase [Candidatus Solibacter usitatus]
GVCFSNVYSQGGMVGAMCLPSRTMLMTGRSVFHIPGRNDPPGNYPLLPKAFESAGYSTFHIGKPGNTYVAASRAFQKTLYAEEAFGVRAEQSKRCADAVIDYIRGHRQSAPFFVYLAPPVPHDPRVAPQRFMDLYDPARLPLPRNFMPEHPFDNGELRIRDEMLAPFPRTPAVMRRHLADYYACITCLDFHIGRILQSIEETGRAGNTIVLSTSDQGLAVGGRHGLMGKQNLYEHFKSPLIVTGPGIRRGRSSALVYMHDLFPTLCDLAGVRIPAGVEGSSLAPIIRGKQRQVRDSLFAVYKDCQRMVRDSRWKLIWYPKINRFQLFDLANDPWEIDDLAAKPLHASRLEQMKRRLAEHQDQFEDRYAPRPEVGC